MFDGDETVFIRKIISINNVMTYDYYDFMRVCVLSGNMD